MSEFPKGWATAPLDSLQATDGLFSDGDWVESKDQDPNGTIRLLQLADIGDGTFIDKSNRFVNESKFAELRCTEIVENDVLIARMPDPLGRACLMPKLPQRCITVVDVAIFRPGISGVSPRWLMHAINAPQFRAEIELNSSGTTRKRISRGNLSAMPLPIPPAQEQKRIAEKLDTVLARVDACRDRLDRIPALLKRFRQSILAAATSGRLTEDWRATHHCGIGAHDMDSPPTRSVSLGEEQLAVPQTWGRYTLSDLINKKRPLCYGVVQPGNEADDGVPLVRVQDMENGAILIAGLRTVSKSVDLEYKRSRVVAGDLLVSIVGTIGRTAVVPAGFEGNIARAIARIAPSAKVLAQWLDCWLSAPAVQWWLLSSSREVARKTLNLAQLAETPVAVPSLDEQHEIVRRVETLFAFADRLEARLATARKQAGQLTPALLAKAFRGELVPQDPKDEPATELLKRLATQREAEPKSRRAKNAATL